MAGGGLAATAVRLVELQSVHADKGWMDFVVTSASCCLIVLIFQVSFGCLLCSKFYYSSWAGKRALRLFAN
jgi:hypothetical protein